MSPAATGEPPGPKRSRRWRVYRPVIGVAVGLVAASACAGEPTASTTPTVTAAPGAGATSPPVAPRAPVATTSPGPLPFSPTTVVVPAARPAPATGCPSPTDDTTSTAPPEVATALAGPVADRRLNPGNASISVWVDGWGEVVAVSPDTPLVPASNQKLLVASAALTMLDPGARPRTTVVATGPTVAGVVQGDLVLVGGGDPDLGTTGPRSLDALAQLVRSAGIVGATGRALIDEQRYDDQRTVAGWPAGTGDEAGAGGLGALVVDRNRGDAAGITSRDARAFADALRTHGITTVGSPGATAAPVSGGELAGLDGPTYVELIGQMLQLSDGLVAETVAKELGRRGAGTGSTAAGLDAARAALAPLCVALAGTDQDGSGFSYDDKRSAREWRRLLQAARRQPWGDQLFAALPVAGRTGTLARRLTGPATTGNVHGKTGSLSTAKAMSGYLTTAGGRQATFSIIVNGPTSAPTEAGIDALVTAIAALPN